MEHRRIDAILFDCDGTLVDSESLSLAVLVELVADLGLHVPYEEAMDRFAGKELSVVFGELESRLEAPLPNDFLEIFRGRQIDVLKQNLQAIPGAHELLRGLTIPFCVASNAPRSKIEVCLTTTGLGQFFHDSRIFSAYEVEKWKPEPDLFLQAASAMDVPPQNCAVVEDSQFGIQAGLCAGMQVFAYNPHGKVGIFADGVTEVQRLSQLTEIFDRAAAGRIC